MHPNQPPTTPEELPGKVTLVWLFHHVPIQGWMALAGLLVGATAIGIGIGKSPLVTSSECADPSPPEVRITSPSHLAQIDESVDVAGTHELTSDDSIWVAIFSYKVNRYFPHRFPARITSTGWTVSDLRVGTPDGEKTKFEIVVFLVDDRGRVGLSEYFDSPEREGFYSPLTGMIEQDRVSVTRLPRE